MYISNPDQLTWKNYTVDHDLDLHPIYRDSVFTIYKIADKKISRKARPLILLSGNEREIYNTKTSDAKKSSMLALDEKTFSHYYQPYDKEIHQPYIAVFTYTHHPEYSVVNFAENLIYALEICEIKEYDIIAKSLGGLIALEMLNHDPSQINHAYILNAPIYGSTLAQRNILKKDLEIMKSILEKYGAEGLKNEMGRTRIDKLIVTLTLNNSKERYATTKDMAYGLRNLPDVNKFTYFSGNIFEQATTNYGNSSSSSYEWLQRKMMELSAEYIYHARGIQSDGIITFDSQKIFQNGIDFVNCPGIDHLKLSKQGYLTHAYQKVYERSVKSK